MRHTLWLIGATVLTLTACGSDDGATATFTSPDDASTIAGGVTLVMSAEGITIEEAGEANSDAGHFHVIAAGGCVATGEAIVKDADHVHFGKGQAEGVIYLDPGEHKLCLQVGDGVHTALDITDTVEVTIAISDQAAWCAVVGEVDEMFAEVDSSSDEFATKQIGYENINRLVTQLQDGVDQLDATVRDDLVDTLAFADDLTTAFVEAEDEQATEESVGAVFEAYPERLAGTDWIKQNCDVDIDG